LMLCEKNGTATHYVNIYVHTVVHELE
jgi:hypothetical protein